MFGEFLVSCPKPRGGGGGTLIFSSYVSLDLTPKNIRNIKQPPNISPFCTKLLRKDLKMHRNDI